MNEKKISLVLAILLMLTLTACGGGSPASTETPSEAPSETPTSSEKNTTPISEPPSSEISEDSEISSVESKILIAYFSSSGNIVTDEEPRGNVGHGNTKTVADMIQAQVGGDLFFIETVDKYPANYNDTIDVAMQEQRADARPALASHVENMDDYDVIFLGYPNWWGTLPQPVFTFLDEYDFSGKTVIPFCTHEGSGFGRSIEDLESILANSTILEGFSVRGSSAANAEEDIKEWISELNFDN